MSFPERGTENMIIVHWQNNANSSLIFIYANDLDSYEAVDLCNQGVLSSNQLIGIHDTQ